MYCNRYLHRILKIRKMLPKPEEDQGSFSEDMPQYEIFQGKWGLDPKERRESHFRQREQV